MPVCVCVCVRACVRVCVCVVYVCVCVSHVWWNEVECRELTIPRVSDGKPPYMVKGVVNGKRNNNKNLGGWAWNTTHKGREFCTRSGGVEVAPTATAVWNPDILDGADESPYSR